MPIETSLMNNSKTSFGLAGDIEICEQDKEGLENIITNYCIGAQKHQKDLSCSGGFGMMSWDASSLPIRGDGSIDCIISDLPFGVKCMSAKRLQTFLPLLFSECARVLRKSGRMTLLCGSSYKHALDALSVQTYADKTYHGKPNDKIYEDEIEEGKTVQCLFQVDSIFPVNIGGLAGWIILTK